MTNWPWIYAIVVLSIFIVTSLVFILYDILVQKRQIVVMRSATTANAVVSSLFPSAFHQRILNAEEEKQRPRQSGAKAELTNFLQERKTMSSFASKPIADLFPESTVMYANLSGFTSWSSAR